MSKIESNLIIIILKDKDKNESEKISRIKTQILRKIIEKIKEELPIAFESQEKTFENLMKNTFNKTKTKQTKNITSN